MILDLDIGNTRCKWRTQSMRGDERNAGYCTLEGLLTQEFACALANPPRRIRVSCVRAQDVESAVREWGVGSFGIQPEFAVAEACRGGVTNAYSEPHRLGVDRWLAMLAAFAELQTSLCVIDCGSAITADLVAADGRHLGGYIAPGLDMLRGALLKHTAKVRFDAMAPALELLPGTSTKHGVAAGTTLAVLGMVGKIIQTSRQLCANPRIVFTGGDGALIREAVEQPSEYRAELVIDGLAIALP